MNDEGSDAFEASDPFYNLCELKVERLGAAHRAADSIQPKKAFGYFVAKQIIAKKPSKTLLQNSVLQKKPSDTLQRI